MILRRYNDRVIVLPINEQEEKEYLKAQEGGKIEFIKVDSIPFSKYNNWRIIDSSRPLSILNIEVDEERNLKKHKEVRKSQIKSGKKANQAKNVKVGDNIFIGGKESASDIDKTKRLFELNAKLHGVDVDLLPIGTVNNGVVSLTAVETDTVIITIGSITQQCWVQEQTLNAQIDSKTTMDGVDEVVWVDVPTGV